MIGLINRNQNEIGRNYSDSIQNFTIYFALIQTVTVSQQIVRLSIEE